MPKIAVIFFVSFLLIVLGCSEDLPLEKFASDILRNSETTSSPLNNDRQTAIVPPLVDEEAPMVVPIDVVPDDLPLP